MNRQDSAAGSNENAPGASKDVKSSADHAPPADELELVAKAQAGDTAAFDELVTRYRSRAFSMIYNMVRNELETAIADAISKASESDYRVTVVSIEYGDNCLKDECRLVLDVAVPISSFGFTESETQNK